MIAAGAIEPAAADQPGVADGERVEAETEAEVSGVRR